MKQWSFPKQNGESEEAMKPQLDSIQNSSLLPISMLEEVAGLNTLFSPKYYANVTNISFIQSTLLDTLQSATATTCLFSQEATAVVHGYSVCVLGSILGEFTEGNF